MRRISLNARAAQDAVASDEVEVLLIRITHPDLAEPLRLSSDATTRITSDPLTYGTRSSWGGVDGAVYWFVLASTMLPDDTDDAPAAATIIVEAVDHDIAAALRSTTQRATVAMAVVLAATPDVVEAEWTNLSLVSAEGDAGEIRLSISRDPITSEPWPARRMTRAAFPGLHR